MTNDRGVVHDDVGERITFQFCEEVEAGSARKVVQAVAVLQTLHLRFEYETKGRSQQPAERLLRFRESAHPEIDGVHAGGGHTVGAACPRAGAVHEIEAVGRG